MNREQLPPDVKAAIEWIGMDLPDIVSQLGESLASLKHELRSLTREVEAMEAATEGFRPTFPRSAAWERRNPVRVLPM